MKTEQRIEIERKIISYLLKQMLNNGWIACSINDGEGTCTIVRDNKEAIELVFSLDECWIVFCKNNFTRTVLVVLGNDGYDCIADHSCSCDDEEDDFEGIMQAVHAYSEKFQ